MERQAFQTVQFLNMTGADDQSEEQTDGETLHQNQSSKQELETSVELDQGEIGDEEHQPSNAGEEKISNRKQNQLALFDRWFDGQVGTLSILPKRDEDRDHSNGVLSLQDLMEKQQSEIIISGPREYQMELFDRAKKQNTIAVLDTGSGKTLIAVLLLRFIIDEELERRASGKPPKISFFLVDKVTLVFQQHAVLKANLDQKIARLCGAMGCDLWTKETWAKYFQEYMVVVCTADVLLHCLFRSFVTIEEINLLVFDEAHHAKKDHAYARIIKEFYLTQRDLTLRPRLFGMTASPVDVDAREDLLIKAQELETLLHSRIATASNLDLLRKVVHRPNEIVLQHNSLLPAFKTSLYREIFPQFDDSDGVTNLFAQAQTISRELGRWCADVFWSFAFSDHASKKREAKLDQKRFRQRDTPESTLIDSTIRKLQKAHEQVAAHDFGIPQVTGADLSPKVIELYEYLGMYFERPSDTRCLVFVERRATAKILETLFDRIGSEHLRSGSLVGAKSESFSENSHTFKQQVVTLMKFKNGDINCLFATSVAEEGLDIQDCNLVIRFDLCRTMIQYVQSRGRARHKNSKFVHLIEKNNLFQREQLRNVSRAENLMREFCERLPENRKLNGNEKDLKDAIEFGRKHRAYVEPSTGAKLTYDFSLIVLSHFVACLPNEENEELSINYAMSVQGGQFVCEVILPAKSPVRSAIGRPAAQKAIAKRSAAFEACILLRKGKYINEYLLPTYAKSLPKMRNALLALTCKTARTYEVQLKPKFWEVGRGSPPLELFLTVIHISGDWERPVQPLGLMTRKPLPQLPQFDIHKISGDGCTVVINGLDNPVQVNSEKLSHLTGFTLQILHDLFNKTFESVECKMPYWLAPLVCGTELRTEFSPDPNHLIDWDLTALIHVKKPWQWTSDTPNQQLANKFVLDHWDGGRRLFTHDIAKNLKPADPIPEGSASGPRRLHGSTIMEYSNSMFSGSRNKRAWNLDQPVIEAERISHRLNILAKPTAQEKSISTKCYICPEPFDISMLPPAVAAMALTFPAIIHRIESYLIGLEFSEELHLSVTPTLALEAITKDSDNTDDAQSEQINVRPGMGPNYERLEFMGDCFLKMATSMSLFVLLANKDEFTMHVERMQMLCNKNLFENAKANEWFRYIRSLGFSRRTWYPEGPKLLAGRGANKKDAQAVTQKLSDKSIADVCEAMIGAAFVTHFTSGYAHASQFDNAVRAVTKFVVSDNHKMVEWFDYYKSYKIPSYQIGQSSAVDVDLAAKIQVEHGYEFHYPRLLRAAFSHASQPRMFESVPSYERLEFLGDSLLDMTSVTHLFFKYPAKDPQWLTEHKMAMVSNKFFGALCVNLGLHKHLRHNDPAIAHNVAQFAEEIAEAREQANGAVDYWISVKDPPKCLPDIVESFVGAIFVDSEFDYAEVQRFFDNNIKCFFEDMAIYDTFANHHPTTKLHKLLGVSMGCQNYRLMGRDLPSEDQSGSKGLAAFILHEQIVGEGCAGTIRQAKVKASVDALDNLEGLSPHDFRIKYGCDCMESGEGQVANIEETMGTAV